MPPATLPSFTDVYSRIESELSPETVSHSIGVAQVARRLATFHGVDPDRAEFVALVHDVADRYSDRELLVLAEKYGIPISLTEARIPKLLHGPIGAEVLRHEWGISDEEILDAVRDHITGSAHMSTLAKIVFVADKIEPGRDKYYGGLNPIREAATKSLDEAILRLYAWRMSDLVERGYQVDERMVEARNRLIDQHLAAGR